MSDIIGLHGAPKTIECAPPADLGRGRLPRPMRRPVIYFAGRTDGCKRGNDWRDAVEGFDGLYAAECAGAKLDSAIDCGDFWYGGPFTISGFCGRTSGHTSFSEEHQDIWDIDRGQIERADLILAFLEDTQAFGTLVEIGFAAALGKPIALGFDSSMTQREYGELWLCRMTAAKVYVGGPGYVWRCVRSDWIV